MRAKIANKVLRPALSFLVERFFPEGAFYGRDYLRDLKSDTTLVEKWGSIEMACMMMVTNNLRSVGATEAEFTASDVTYNGIPQGSWKITVTQEEQKYN